MQKPFLLRLQKTKQSFLYKEDAHLTRPVGFNRRVLGLIVFLKGRCSNTVSPRSSWLCGTSPVPRGRRLLLLPGIVTHEHVLFPHWTRCIFSGRNHVSFTPSIYLTKGLAREILGEQRPCPSKAQRVGSAVGGSGWLRWEPCGCVRVPCRSWLNFGPALY